MTSVLNLRKSRPNKTQRKQKKNDKSQSRKINDIGNKIQQRKPIKLKTGPLKKINKIGEPRWRCR